MVGLNDDTISKVVDPELTTIDYPGKSIGEIAAASLLNQLQNKSKSQADKTVILKAYLIVRGSSLRLAKITHYKLVDCPTSFPD